MVDIELVVKIPQEEYEMIVNSEDCGLHILTRAIAHGVILPKGHGRLIDADEQINRIEKIYNGYMLSEDEGVTASDFVEFLEEAPTIIKADKE